MRDREYLYTVLKRGAKTESGYEWEHLEVKATSMIEISRLTQTKLDDLIYITKRIVK